MAIQDIRTCVWCGSPGVPIGRNHAHCSNRTCFAWKYEWPLGIWQGIPNYQGGVWVVGCCEEVQLEVGLFADFADAAACAENIGGSVSCRARLVIQNRDHVARADDERRGPKAVS